MTGPGGQAPAPDDEGAGRRLRVAFVDDDTVMREGLPHLLPGLDVTSFASVRELFAASPAVDVVLLDLRIQPGGGATAVQGAAAVRAVTAAGYTVLIYTSEPRPAVVVGCFKVGARGVLHKSKPIADLQSAVEMVAAGGSVAPVEMDGLAELLDRSRRLPSLSPQQKQVLAGRARGDSFGEIGRRLYIAPKTAQEYMDDVRRKFASYLRNHSPADLERELGLTPGDLLDWADDDPNAG